jgi:hypothetical protein
MTQEVLLEYLRWITVYLWNCKIPACDHEQKEFRLLDYTSLGDLRRSVLRKLQGLELNRCLELRNHACSWVDTQDSEKLRAWFAAFDDEEQVAQSKPRGDAERSLIDLVL